MVKGRFIVNPFTELALTEHDHEQLKDLANSLIMANLEKYSTYQDEKKKRVDPRRWKLCKQRQGIKMYVERPGTASAGENITGNGLPLIWGLGNKEGKLDDLMFGLVSPTLEAMRVKASLWSFLSILWKSYAAFAAELRLALVERPYPCHN
ncbi:hypothetical protein PF003_g13078 [Phytophthora fragariae]|nr:hypothetical protein PF003_g13078 [Phytophthora fragariae]